MQGEDLGLKPLIDGIKKYKEVHIVESDLPELSLLMDTAVKAESKSATLNNVLLKEPWMKKAPKEATFGNKTDREGRHSELSAKIKGLVPSRLVDTLRIRRIEFQKKKLDEKKHNIYTDIGRKEIMKRIRADPNFYKSRMTVMSGNTEYCHFIINDIKDKVGLPLMMLNKCKEGSRNKFLLKLPISKSACTSTNNILLPVTKAYTISSNRITRADIECRPK